MAPAEFNGACGKETGSAQPVQAPALRFSAFGTVFFGSPRLRELGDVELWVGRRFAQVEMKTEVVCSSTLHRHQRREVYFHHWHAIQTLRSAMG